MARANEVRVNIVGDADSAVRALNKVEKEAGGFGSKLSAFGGVAKVAGVAMGAGVLAALPGLYKTGTELESMGAKAQTVFGDSLKGVEAWSKANANAMGLTGREATGLAANFADLLVPMGFTQKSAADMSTKVVGLSGALSAWSNGQKTAAEVSTILSKAMLGERDGLKELGISISEADVSGRLLAKGQKDLTGAALEQAKAVATSELIFEKSKDAQNAFTDSTKTNTEKALEAKARMGELTDTLAVGLVPVFAKVTEVGLTVVNFLQNLDGRVVAVVGVIATAVGAVLLIQKAMQAWATVQLAFNAVMAANPIVLVVIAIAALVAGIIWAYKNVSWFRDGVQSAFGAIAAAGQWIGRVFAGVWNGIVAGFVWVRDTLKSIANWLISNVVNKFVDGVNMLIKAANFINPGKDTALVPRIPMLAEGGIVTGPTLAMIGEAGPEAVIPLSRAGGMGMGGSNVTINFNGVTTREAADQVVKVLELHFGRGGALSNGRGGTLAPA